jgi:hypothetical protein
MDRFGDQRIDLLKIDIEGAEYELRPTLDLRAVGVKVLSVQLHHTASVRQAKRLLEWLGGQGYVAVACRPAVKLTFVSQELAAARPSSAPADTSPGADTEPSAA